MAFPCVMVSQEDEALLARGMYWTQWTHVRPLLLATIPRLASNSPLRMLPNELIVAIAKMAHRPRVAPVLSTGSGMEIRVAQDGGMSALRRYTINDGYISCVGPHLEATICGKGVQYFEVDINDMWWNSSFSIGDARIEFETPGDEGQLDGLGFPVNTYAHNVVILVQGGQRRHVHAWDDWHYCDWNQLGLLFDFDGGRVRWVLNGRPGPSTKLPTTADCHARLCFGSDDPRLGGRAEGFMEGMMVWECDGSFMEADGSLAAGLRLFAKTRMDATPHLLDWLHLQQLHGTCRDINHDEMDTMRCATCEAIAAYERL